MSFRGLDASESGNPNKMELGEPRRFGGGMMDDKGMDDPDDRRFDMGGRGRRPPFGRGRRPSPPGRDRPRDYGFGREDSSMRDRSPMHGMEDRFNDRFKKDDGGYKRDDMGRKERPYYGGDSRDRYMDRPSRLDGPGNYNNSRFDGPNESYKAPRPPVSFSGPPKPFYSEGFPKPNECEIIAVNKLQRAYAESVEARIKEMGVLVDVLFLKDEALLTQTVDDIAQRGSLYAMVISPQNETHRSVTVNILHGTPQEHRNMPLEDALKLVSRNFHDHARLQKENMERERVKRGPYSGVVAADREMQMLLRMLADGRWISLGEITAVIRYLTERRDKMQSGLGEERSIPPRPQMPSSGLGKLETTQFKPMPKDDIDVAQKEQDLQKRIINIMNQGVPSVSEPGLNSSPSPLDLPPSRPNPPGMNIQPSMISGIKSSSASQDTLPRLDAKSSGIGDPPPFSSASQSTPSAKSTYLNFNNPTVQKALDDLMQSGPNILKNISLSSSVSPQNTITSTTAKTSSSPSGMGMTGDSLGLQRGGMPPPRGPGGGMSDMPGPARGNLDLGPQRGPSDMGQGPQRGMGGPGSQRGPGDLGSGLQRGPGDLGSGLPRGPGDLGSGLPRGPGDLGGGMPRGPGGMSDMGGPQRGGGNPQDIGGPRGSDMMGMGPPRGGYGSMSEGMGGMRNFGGGSSGMSDQSMGPPPRMNEMGRMSGPPPGMGMGNNYSGPGQFNKFQGGPGSFPGSYNSPRPNYNQGMGGGPRRY